MPPISSAGAEDSVGTHIYCFRRDQYIPHLFRKQSIFMDRKQLSMLFASYLFAFPTHSRDKVSETQGP